MRFLHFSNDQLTTDYQLLKLINSNTIMIIQVLYTHNYTTNRTKCKLESPYQLLPFSHVLNKKLTIGRIYYMNDLTD